MSDGCQKTSFILASVIASVGSLAYSYYLVWLFYYLTNEKWHSINIGIALFWAFLLISIYTMVTKGSIFAIPIFYLFCVVILKMGLFTMLTRQAYYHLSTDDFIGPKWVIMSLKGSIIFFVSGFLIIKGCELKKIHKSEDILTRALLDYVDIFNLVELLSSNEYVGIGSSVTEGSSLEMGIQAVCTMSFLIVFYVISPSEMMTMEYKGIDGEVKNKFNGIYLLSVIFQNLPFLIIRILVWAKYGIFSLGFMVKNIVAIVMCIAAIRKGEFYEQDQEPNNVNPVQPV